MAPDRAKCTHCGHFYVKENLKAAPDGGAICKDWFGCQQRCDKQAEAVKNTPRRFRAV